MTVQELIERLSGFAPYDQVELVELAECFIENDEDYDVYEVEEVRVCGTGPRCRILFTVKRKAG